MPRLDIICETDRHETVKNQDRKVAECVTRERERTGRIAENTQRHRNTDENYLPVGKEKQAESAKAACSEKGERAGEQSVRCDFSRRCHPLRPCPLESVRPVFEIKVIVCKI